MPEPKSSRLLEAFARAKREGRPAIIAYLCAGDPSMDETAGLIEALAAGGADIVELGVPFSDPTADGPVIQRASERALASGATLAKVLTAARQARARCDVPLVLFGYYNPILSYGEARLASDAKAAGIDGLLVVDLPLEECAVLREPALAAGLEWLPLVARATPDARAAAIGALATSFVYLVSTAGVTGVGQVDFEAARERAAQLEALTGKPVAVGFGVRSASDVAALGRSASGVVVGSALVAHVAEGRDAEERRERARAFVRGLR